MKKIDIISWILSIIINLLILFALAYKPFINVEDVQTIKVGLISEDTEASTKFRGEDNRDAFNKNLDAKTIEENNEKKEVETQKNEDVEPIENNETNSKDTEKNTVEIKKEKPSLSDLKKSISESKPSSKELIKNNESFSPSDGDFEYVDRKISVSGDSNGLISGNISGTSDGNDILIIWSNSNKNPAFPDKAKMQGKTGSMVIRIEVDQAGTIRSYTIEEGSGVPEIDLAVEKVIGSWNLKMKKNNKIVAGVFKLDYKFDFK